jgi:hypothetical protein
MVQLDALQRITPFLKLAARRQRELQRTRKYVACVRSPGNATGVPWKTPRFMRMWNFSSPTLAAPFMDRMRKFAKELVDLRPEVILAHSVVSAHAAV